MYEGDYWISADKQTDDFGSYYYITIEVLKRLSMLHRDGVLVTFNGMRNFVEECVSFYMSECWSVLCRWGSLGAK